MSNWITGKELIALWDIEGFELFDCLQKGLQPYSWHGHKITNTDNLEHAPFFSLEQCIARVRRTNRPTSVEPPSGTGHEPFQRFIPMSEQEILQKARKDYEAQTPQPVNPPRYHMSFKLPLDDKKAWDAIAMVMALKFRKNEASEFAKQYGYRVLEEQNEGAPSASQAAEPFVKDWISCGELLENGLKPFELFKFFESGHLHPYHPINGKKIIDLDTVVQKPEQSFEEVLKKEIWVNNLRGGDEGTTKVFTRPGAGHYNHINNGSDAPWPLDKVKAHARQKYEALPKFPVIPEDCIAVSFTLLNDPVKTPVADTGRSGMVVE